MPLDEMDYPEMCQRQIPRFEDVLSDMCNGYFKKIISVLDEIPVYFFQLYHALCDIRWLVYSLYTLVEKYYIAWIFPALISCFGLYQARMYSSFYWAG